MKKWLLLGMVIAFIVSGCSNQTTKEEGSSIQSDQFQLDDASFVAPKSWTGKYEVVNEENRSTVLHICEQAEVEQELFSLVKLTKEQFQEGGERTKEALVAQVGSNFYVVFMPLDLGYAEASECAKEYNEMFLPFDSVKARITVR